MDYRTSRSYHVSKVWLVITIFVFSISLLLMQVMYHTAKVKPDFDIAFLTISYLIPIVLCFVSLTLSHFQMLRIGAFFGILVGIDLITNIAFTDIINNSTYAIIKLFEPIFSLLPLLNVEFGTAQFDLIINIMQITQVLFGIFLIIIHIPVLFRNSRSVV
ncbi:MAG: hypothetical protein IJ809_06450 [Clostridia bacterium]|nr:hypothetical protein [Clostridia bacterium]